MSLDWRFGILCVIILLCILFFGFKCISFEYFIDFYVMFFLIDESIGVE